MNPIPADPELEALKARLQRNMAEVAKKGDSCRPGSRIHRMKTRMVNTKQVAAQIEEAEEVKDPDLPSKVNGPQEPERAPLPATQRLDRP